MPPVSRRSLGPSSDAARVRWNCASAWCSSVRASSTGSVIAASGHSSSRGSALGGPESVGQPPRRFLVEAGAPLVLLTDVGLDDADVDGPSADRAGPTTTGSTQRNNVDAENHHQRQPLPVIFEPDGAAEQDHQADKP